MNRRHLLLLVCVILNIIIFSLNHIVGAVVNHGDYTPFSVAPQVSALVWDESSFYIAGPGRFFHIGDLRSEVDVFEMRDVRSDFPIVHYVLLGALANALGSLEWTWIVSHAVLPTAIWAFLFWRARAFVHYDSLAMVIAWLTCFVSFSPRNFLLIAPGRFAQPLEITRTPQPALSFLLLLVATWALSQAMARPTVARICAAGLFAGVLFHAYYFYWITFFGGIGCLMGVLMFIRRWDLVKTIASVLAIGSLVGLPIFIWAFDGVRAGYPHDLMRRLGTFTREPDIIGALFAIVLVFILWVYCQQQLRAKLD